MSFINAEPRAASWMARTCAVLLLFLVPSVSTAQKVWTGAGGDNKWTTAANWSGGTAPVVSPGANAVDIYGLVTRTGGSTWFGFPGGKGFS